MLSCGCILRPVFVHRSQQSFYKFPDSSLLTRKDILNALYGKRHEISPGAIS